MRVKRDILVNVGDAVTLALTTREAQALLARLIPELLEAQGFEADDEGELQCAECGRMACRWAPSCPNR